MEKKYYFQNGGINIKDDILIVNVEGEKYKLNYNQIKSISLVNDKEPNFYTLEIKDKSDVVYGLSDKATQQKKAYKIRDLIISKNSEIENLMAKNSDVAFDAAIGDWKSKLKSLEPKEQANIMTIGLLVFILGTIFLYVGAEISFGFIIEPANVLNFAIGLILFAIGLYVFGITFKVVSKFKKVIVLAIFAVIIWSKVYEPLEYVIYDKETKMEILISRATNIKRDNIELAYMEGNPNVTIVLLFESAWNDEGYLIGFSKTLVEVCELISQNSLFDGINDISVKGNAYTVSVDGKGNKNIRSFAYFKGDSSNWININWDSLLDSIYSDYNNVNILGEFKQNLF